MYTGSASTTHEKVIDLRSDTVTRPSSEMRKMMASSVVGDDVYRDDPTVNALEEKVAELLGKEAALFIGSGTQSNLIALLTHCGRGDEYISGDAYHIARYEAQGAAVLGGIAPFHLPVDARGGLSADAVKAAIKEDDPHYAITRTVCLENTVYGRVQDQTSIDEIAKVSHAHNLSVHLDGARLMNAVVKSNQTASSLVESVDTVSLCLSKGLGAPVGSVLSGPKAFIERARRNRKLLGGAMRQAGVLAACGLYALDNNIERLAEDHRRAHDLADVLSRFDAFDVQRDQLDTNMVFVKLDPAHVKLLYLHLEKSGILFGAPAQTIRLVTHLDIDDADIETIGKVIEEYFLAI